MKGSLATSVCAVIVSISCSRSRRCRAKCPRSLDDFGFELDARDTRDMAALALDERHSAFEKLDYL